MDYIQAFKREMYRHLREDFEDSFTPGGYSGVKHQGKPVMVPPIYFRERAPLIEEKLSAAGLKKPAGLSTEQLMKDTFHEGGGIVDYQANPSTPKIPEEMYHPFFEKFFKTEGVRKNPIKPTDVAERQRQFKSATMHLAQLYLKQVLNLAPEDFAFGAKADATAQRKVLINQYRRYVMGMVTMSLLELVYSIKPSQMDEFLKESGFERINNETLKKRKTRDDFAAGVRATMSELFAGKDLGQAMLTQIRKKKVTKA
jgi:hypothetical protein